jgi:protoporphyrinogen oxidase
VRLGIVGGGALGLTVALRRVMAGDEVVVLEKGSEPGGLAVSFPLSDEPNAPYLEKFYHHIFQTDKDIIRVIGEMGLADDLIWDTPPTSTLRGGKIYRMDSFLDDRQDQPIGKLLRPVRGSAIDTALAILRFKPLPFLARLRFGMVGAYLKFENNYGRLSKITAAQWVQKWAGKSAYENVFKPLLSAKFGSKFDQIAMPWLWSRFHERTQFLGYVKGGFHKLYIRMYEKVKEVGGQVWLNCEVTGVRSGTGDSEGKVIVTVNGREEIFDKVVVTAPTRVFVQMAKVRGRKFGRALRSALRGVIAQATVLSARPYLLAERERSRLSVPGGGGAYELYACLRLRREKSGLSRQLSADEPRIVRCVR